MEGTQVTQNLIAVAGVNEERAGFVRQTWWVPVFSLGVLALAAWGTFRVATMGERR